MALSNPDKKINPMSNKGSDVQSTTVPKEKVIKHIVLLQGPVGPFMDRLHRHLLDGGYRVTRFIFNAGDRWFSSRLKGQISFNGSLVGWNREFERFLLADRPDMVVCFGSERPAHKIARELTGEQAIPLLSLEEGYLRPGFVTVEAGGNNASSPLAGSIPSAEINAEALHAEVANPTDYKSFSSFVRYSGTYYIIRTFFSWKSDRELFHRRFFPPLEAFYWLRNAYRNVFHGGADNPIIHRLLEHHPSNYFIVPLQVAADSNLKEAAMGWNSQRLIVSGIQSFAKHARQDSQLVFKVHPLERGHNRFESLIQEVSKDHGVLGRVHLIDTGSMGLLARHSAGMITINSTSGLSAIHHGVPLLVIGKAVYEHPKLAVCGNGKPDFDRFWHYSENYPPVAPVAFRHEYLDWLRQQALVRGDFYDTEGIKVACAGVQTRIEAIIRSRGFSDVGQSVSESDDEPCADLAVSL